jgi:adenine-specific DNA-methyltransferase
MNAPRLELVWPGKDKFLLVPKDETGKPVWVERDHPAASEVRLADLTGVVGKVPDDPYAANLLFTGDSLDVLRILCEVPEYRAIYRGKVKLVYIDPPFNTGQAFEHYDDWMEHSTWLSFMRERLLLIRDLLSPDGSVWVHLDDAEQHRMRCLMDEVFATRGFVASVVWEKARGAKGDTHISTSQDYLAVYALDRDLWKRTRNLLPRSESQEARYANPDNDPRGPWRQGADGTAKSGSDDLRFPITLPSGRVVRPPQGNFWRFTQSRFETAVEEGRVHFGRKGDSMPVIKTYLAEIKDGVVPHSWWSSDEVGSNQEAKRDHLRKLFPGVIPFATPKPERLLQRVVHIASNKGDIVLDCFAGSGTTAAVAHKMGRRWVTSEILSSTVEQFTLPRLMKVVAGEDPGGITKAVGWEGGGGFQSVTVGPSMYEDTPFGVLLAEWATNGRFARAVAGQLGFEFQPDAAPLCGVRGRMRLAVIDGTVGPEEIRQIVGALGEKERVTIVAKSVLPQAETILSEVSPGSRIRKAPRDLLTSGARRMRRRTDASPRHTSEMAEGSGS